MDGPHRLARSLDQTTPPFDQKLPVDMLDVTLVGTAAAVIDRIVHHATVIATEGESYRLQDAQARARRGAAAREREVRPA